MKATAINFLALCILLSFTVKAIEISFVAPEEVQINEEFSVEISADTSEIYDVKIYIHTSEDQKVEAKEYSSEIKGDSWQNSWYYLKSVFPEENLFSVRATSSHGDRTICVKLRKTETSSTSEKCKPIKVKGTEESKAQEESKEIDEEVVESPIENHIAQAQENTIIEQAPLVKSAPEPILLNSPPPSTVREEIVFESRSEKIRKGALYSFLLICLLVIFFLALKKL